MINAIIIGTGQIGKTHAEAMKKSSHLKLVGFMGNNFEKTKVVAELYGAEAFESFERLDNESIDMAIVCTPSYIRKEIIYKLVDKKINILCEKPFALTYEEGKLMKEYAKAKGIKIMVGHVLRFWPAYVKIREVIEEGRLGDIIHIYSNRLSSYPAWTGWHKNPNKSGGGLYDLAIHDLDYLVYLFGSVESVDAIGRKDESASYNFTLSNLKFANGKQATVESNMDVKGDYPFTTFVRVIGTRGTLEYESSKKLDKNNSMESYESFMEYIDGSKPRKLEVIKYNPYQKQMEYFASCIEKDKATEIIRMEEVLHVLKLLEKIKRSIEEWANTDIKGEISKVFPEMQIYVENDANVAALCESWIGGGKDFNNFVMLTLGTGVGGAIYTEKEGILKGNGFQGGELGHAILYPKGVQCNCGQQGCVDKYISGNALGKRYFDLTGEIKKGKDIFKDSLLDETSRKLVDEYCEDMAIYIASLKNIFDPQGLIIGGGVINSKDIWWDKMKEHFKKHSNSTDKMKIVPAQYLNDAGMIGAARVVLLNNKKLFKIKNQRREVK